MLRPGIVGMRGSMVLSTAMHGTITPPLPCLYIAFGVGRQQRCNTCQSLRELDHQGAVFFIFRRGVGG